MDFLSEQELFVVPALAGAMKARLKAVLRTKQIAPGFIFRCGQCFRVSNPGHIFLFNQFTSVYGLETHFVFFRTG